MIERFPGQWGPLRKESRISTVRLQEAAPPCGSRKGLLEIANNAVPDKASSTYSRAFTAG